jgi:SAM-dependent methyltransferase
MEFTEEQLQHEAAFADEHYAPYAQNLDINPAMLRKYTDPKNLWDWREFGAHMLGPVNGCELLDLGCGMGEEAMYFAKLGARVTAIDISPVGIDIARKRAAHNGVADHVRALVMRADEPDFAAASFDVVHGFGILHHIGLERGLEEVRRLLRPGGRALFFEHMGNSALVERLRTRANCTDYEQPVHFRDVVENTRAFSKAVVKPFGVLLRLRTLTPRLNTSFMRRCDYVLLKAVPALKHFAGGLVIYLEK